MTSRLALALLAYVAVGAVAGWLVARRASGGALVRAGHAALAGLAWPLLAPLYLGREPSPSVPDGPLDRLRAAAEEVRGTPFEALLPASVVAALEARVLAALERTAGLREAERLLAARVATTTAGSTVESQLRAHRARLRAMLAADEGALEAVGDTCELLRAQLVLARFAGAPPEGLSDILVDLRARLEGLDQALDPYRPEP